MSKRSTQVETTTFYKNGGIEVKVNKNKMNRGMCDKIIKSLSDDYKGSEKIGNDVERVEFRCVG